MGIPASAQAVQNLEGRLFADVAKKVREASRPMLFQEPHNRWLHASALQKAVRRGDEQQAKTHAHVLLTIDPKYCWQRLRIIAMEDVGTANLNLVAAVLMFASRSVLRVALGESDLVSALAADLAAGEKDRTACDLLTWIDQSPTLDTFRQSLLAEDRSAWTTRANDETAPVWQRLVALRLIAGLTLRTSTGYRTVTRPDTAGFRALVDAWDLPELAKYVCTKAMSTASLNVALPFACMLRSTCADSPLRNMSPAELACPRIGGFSAAAMCQYTRIGKRAIRQFLAEDSPFRKEIVRAGACSPTAATGLLVFQVESGLLDRFRDFAPGVRVEAERGELAQCGTTNDHAAETLRSMLRERLPDLHQARRYAWNEYEQSGQDR